MQIPIYPFNKILRTCDAFGSKAGAENSSLRNPALDKPDTQRPIDVTLEAPATPVK